jgi:hypothetical protein
MSSISGDAPRGASRIQSLEAESRARIAESRRLLRETEALVTPPPSPAHPPQSPPPAKADDH